ncbi:MAG TPA: Ldh family oxidoreductase [Bacillota bacterium]|nr:Ldh family oxidoreductase [Bacillota bacterium]HOL14727.1 Ldh family oxidoreductase [Bacillota bacterium]HPZ11701.1 Ldh family oxidoreductase [Bacillota bacterium]HQE10050.1 Ldh family oxidoreductase [Bacillota bacterium]
MSEQIVWITFETMENFMADVFEGVGVPENEARICADVLITADKWGIDSHGIGRLKTIYYDRIRDGIQFPVTNFELLREGPTTAVVDGHHGMGQVIAKKAMDLAIDKARRYGMGMVAVRNSTHFGICGYYLKMAADAGMIGMVGTNARPSIAPTFGVENMLGTNPLTFGFPTDEAFPFLLDCATSVTQRGRIEVYARAGEKIPQGLVIDEQGNSMTDPEQVLIDLVKGKAALAPLGGIGEDTAGYKGYGYATVVEVLSAALQGGAFLKQLTGFDKDGRKVPYRLGHFFMAVNIEAFTGLADFKQATGGILRQLRASKKAPGRDRIYTAGEKEYLAWLERKDKGVPVGRKLQEEMLVMRDELGLTRYRFPFE